MVVLKVYGTGCAKCVRLEANAEAAAKSLGLDYSIEKVTDRGAISAAGILFTPALTVDGEVKVAGKAPSPEELAPLLRA